MSKLIDCFTFYNELEILELRLSELYEVVDKFILVEADKTFKGEEKKFLFDENKNKFAKWMDKIIHIKINFPDLKDSNPWVYEKYQRNSFMPSLYFLNLQDTDKVMITDVDEIPDSSTISYIKNYPLFGIYKLEMEHYFGCFGNKMTNPEKWYHPKIMNWGHLKNSTPDSCRNDFNCQWWEKGGWHLSYFGGSERIVQKIKSFSHQEYNNPSINNQERIVERIKENKDFLDDWRNFLSVDPELNPYLPKNWRILEPFEEEYFPKSVKKDLVLGAALNMEKNSLTNFLKSFRAHNQEADICLIVERDVTPEKLSIIRSHGAKVIFSSLTEFVQTPVNNLRYVKFYEFLLENQASYRNVLLSDVRDVYFQKNPFEGIQSHSIFFAQEEENKSIKDDLNFNSRWLEKTYGREILEKLQDEKITCCGTVLGSSLNCLSYLKFMTDEIVRIYKDKEIAFNDMLDTPIHTFIYYIKPQTLRNLEMKANGDLFGTVGITIQEFPEKIEVVDNLITVNGKIPAIIHQYDRSPWLTSFIKNNCK